MQSMKNHGISYYWFVVWSNHLNLFHSAKLGTLGSCNLLLSDVQQGDTPRSLFIYKRWINSIYTIRADGKGSYILNNIGSSESETKKARKAKYSIALQYLVLEEISN